MTISDVHQQTLSIKLMLESPNEEYYITNLNLLQCV